MGRATTLAAVAAVLGTVFLTGCSGEPEAAADPYEGWDEHRLRTAWVSTPGHWEQLAGSMQPWKQFRATVATIDDDEHYAFAIYDEPADAEDPDAEPDGRLDTYDGMAPDPGGGAESWLTTVSGVHGSDWRPRAVGSGRQDDVGILGADSTAGYVYEHTVRGEVRCTYEYLGYVENERQRTYDQYVLLRVTRYEECQSGWALERTFLGGVKMVPEGAER